MVRTVQLLRYDVYSPITLSQPIRFENFVIVKMIIIILIITRNSNRTEWSTIQGVIRQASNFKFQIMSLITLNCQTQRPIDNSITNHKNLKIGIFIKVQIKILLHHIALEKLLDLSRNGSLECKISKLMILRPIDN